MLGDQPGTTAQRVERCTGRGEDTIAPMTIAPPSNGSAPQGDGSEAFRRSAGHAATTDTQGTDVVPTSMREERLETQIALFVRAGYRIEQRTQLRAVVVREHKRRVFSRIVDTVRTLGVVPLLTGAPRAYHRVLITIDDDGAVQIL